jgi:hypothetical protein
VLDYLWESMEENWMEIATDVLSEHVGALAPIVIDDALGKMKLKSATQMPSAFRAEFILRVVQELPESVNRAGIAAELRASLR